MFPYRPFAVEPTPAYPSTTTLRSEIPVWIGAVGGRRKPFLGLLDTGSDDTKIPLYEANRLGVAVDRDHPIIFRGVGGLVRGFIRRGDSGVETIAQVLDLVGSGGLPSRRERRRDEDHVDVTLGHAGFFRFFHAAFDYQRGRVRIRPNGLFTGLSP